MRVGLRAPPPATIQALAGYLDKRLKTERKPSAA
jgi:hypothetical protein